MKYLILFFCMLCFLNINKTPVLAKNNYARVINLTNLYKSTNGDDLSDIICIVEKTYFVEIISETSNVLKVNYNGICGYVRKNDVKVTLSNPLTPYPSNIKIVVGFDCNLRSSPTTKTNVSNIISVVNAGETNLQFIGRVFSEEAIDFGGTTWYYVNYNGEYGYIYNKYIRSITPIYENTEEVSYASNTNTNIKNPMTHTPSLILVIIMSVPLFAILFILYLPRKFHKKQKLIKSQKIIDKY